MLSVMDPATLVLTVMAAVAILVTSRLVFARMAMAGTMRATQSRIASFKNGLVAGNLSTSDAATVRSAGTLATIGKAANDMRHAAVHSARSIRRPAPSDIKEPPQVMHEAMLAMGVLVAGYSVAVAQYKVVNVLSQDVAHNVKGAAASVPVHDVIDTHISAALHAFGITDLATDFVSLLGTIHIPASLGHFIVEGAAIPGIGTALATGWREYNMLKNDQTTWKASLVHGAAPAAVTAAGVKGGAIAGAKLGTMVGTYLFPGPGSAAGAAIGSLAGALGGWLGGNAYKEKQLERAINADRAKLEPHLVAIRAAVAKGSAAVNAVIIDAFGDFDADVERHPHLHKGKRAQVLAEKMVQSLEQDAAHYRAVVRDQAQEQIDRVAAKNWLDHLLFIDRRASVVDAYRKAADAEAAAYAEHVARFTVLARSDFEKAGAMLRDGALPLKTDGAFIKVARTLDVELKPVAQEHDAKRAAWSTSFSQKFRRGQTAVDEAGKRQAQILGEVVTVHEPEMAPLRRDILANYLRLGRAPDPNFFS